MKQWKKYKELVNTSERGWLVDSRFSWKWLESGNANYLISVAQPGITCYRQGLFRLHHLLDVTFSEHNQYPTLRLTPSKIDVKHTVVV